MWQLNTRGIYITLSLSCMRYTDTSRTFNLSLLVQCCISVNGPSRDLKFNRLILFLIKGQGRYWHLALLIWHIWHYIDVDIFLKVNPDTIVEVWKDGFHTELSIITFRGYKTLLSSCWYLSDISYGIDWPKYYNCDPHNFIGTYHSTCTFVGWLF